VPYGFPKRTRQRLAPRRDSWRKEIEVKKGRPVLITVIALLQIVPIILLPPRFYPSLGRLFLILPLVVFGVLGWALLTWRPVGRMLTIFLQGFNVIVRVLITMARIVPSKVPGTPVDTSLLLTSLVSVGLSVVILLYIDQPEVQLLFEA